MTTALVALSLILSPHQLADPPKEPTWPSVMTTNVPDVDARSLSTSFWVDESLLMLVGSPPILLSAPTATTPPPDPPYIPTAADLVDELFGWPGRQLVQCESSWNRWAVGRYGERGLFQVHPLWIPEIVRLGWTWDAMFEVEPNVRMAAHIRRVQGLRAWTCWKG